MGRRAPNDQGTGNSGKRGRRQPVRALLVGGWLMLGSGGCALLGGSPGPPPDPVRDVRIRDRVQERIRAEPSLAASAIRVVVDNGYVQLHGTVAGMGAWECALTNVSLVPEVNSVIDFLVLEAGPREVPCLAVRLPVARG